MSHINVYRPIKARPVTFEDRAEGFVEITEKCGSTINVWLPAGTAQVVADAINGALKVEAGQ